MQRTTGLVTSNCPLLDNNGCISPLQWPSYPNDPFFNLLSFGPSLPSDPAATNPLGYFSHVPRNDTSFIYSLLEPATYDYGGAQLEQINSESWGNLSNTSSISSTASYFYPVSTAGPSLPVPITGTIAPTKEPTLSAAGPSLPAPTTVVRAEEPTLCRHLISSLPLPTSLNIDSYLETASTGKCSRFRCKYPDCIHSSMPKSVAYIHVLRHLRIKTHECITCGRQFSCRAAAMRHCKDSKSHVCGYCGKGFARPDYYKLHTSRCDGDSSYKLP
ncbi:hypothetical protein M422DRAFT_777003, partial [Sphaerobolus stellatus SS14]